MPIYEYRCNDCRKRCTFLVLSSNNPPPVQCKYCQGQNLERVMSRFAAPKSEDARLESLADPSKLGDVDENDPRSMAKFMKKMGQEMGEDFGDELDQAMDETEAGAADGEAGDID